MILSTQISDIIQILHWDRRLRLTPVTSKQPLQQPNLFISQPPEKANQEPNDEKYNDSVNHDRDDKNHPIMGNEIAVIRENIPKQRTDCP